MPLLTRAVSAVSEPPEAPAPDRAPATAPTLYPGQAEGVDRFMKLKTPRRAVFAWDTGCGKTAAAATVMRRVEKEIRSELGRGARILILCPALVRDHWKRELVVWAPELSPHARSIYWGPTSKSASGTKVAERQAAYMARIQIVSYDLIKHIDKDGWDLIIADELHHIANPETQVAGHFLKFFTRLGRAPSCLGLSATLIPTEATQLWNPMRILFPDDGWGRSYRGGIAWTFKRRYCNLETSEYGTDAFGVREDMRGELRTRLLKRCHVLTRQDIAPNLPPLDLHAVTLDFQTRNRKGNCKVTYRCVEWAEGNAAVDKIVVLVHHRAAARAIRDQIRETSLDLRLHHLHYIDGSVPTHARDSTLINCATAPKAILIATHDSLLEGIRLMWADQVLIDEWSQSPGKMTQLMGRFNSVGSSRRPCVNLAVDEDTYGPAQTLIYRLKVVTDLLNAGKTQLSIIDELERAGEMSDADVKTGWLDMFAGANLNTTREDWAE